MKYNAKSIWFAALVTAVILSLSGGCADNKQWTKSVPLSSINTDRYEEWTPFVSFDGSAIYFTRLRIPTPMSYGKIYSATRSGPSEQFTSITEVFKTNNYYVYGPWVSPDSLRMYYTEEGTGGWRIKLSQRCSTSSPWPQGTPLSELNRISQLVGASSLTSDELIIFFSVNMGNPDLGSPYHIYTANRADRNSPFTNIRKVTELCSNLSDKDASVSPDGLTVVFSSDRGHQNNFSLYKAQRDSVDESFGNIEHLSLYDAPRGGSKHPFLSADGTEFFFLKDLGRDNRDIYVSYLIIRQVALDIKPGACPNPFNPETKGVTTAAILGSRDLDVKNIDVASLRLMDVPPLRSSFADVSSPVQDAGDCNCSQGAPDGIIDLVLKFDTQKLAASLVDELDNLNKDDEIIVPLTGFLLDQTRIEGKDCIVIVGSRKNNGLKIDLPPFVKYQNKH
jgi:hypothetical protein